VVCAEIAFTKSNVKERITNSFFIYRYYAINIEK
jgi:hypothetical protein